MDLRSFIQSRRNTAHDKGGVWRSLASSSALAMLLLLPVSHAVAQTTVFPADHYGRTDLKLPESIGNASTFFNKGDTFEPISQFHVNDRVRRISKAIGRLDLLVEKDGSQNLVTCTAAIVRKDLILTNHHCIPGLGGGKIVKASLLLNYLKTDSQGAIRVTVAPDSIETNPQLDYAFAKITGEVPEYIKPLTLKPRRIEPRESLIIIHHPAGQVKMVTKVRCKASPSTPIKGPFLRHVCDTTNGSSGGILFDDEYRAVALHHSGGLNRNDPSSYNKATLLADLLKRTTLVAVAASPVSTPDKVDKTPSSQSATKVTNEETPKPAQQTDIPSGAERQTGDDHLNCMITDTCK